MREGQTVVVPVGDLPNKHIPDHPDAYLNALLDYTKGFYSATREAGLPAKVCADAMQHVESAARGLHRKAMLSAAPQSPAQGQVTREEVALIVDPRITGLEFHSFTPESWMGQALAKADAILALFHTGETKGDGRG